MKFVRTPRHRLAGWTRREWLVGSGVVLALLGLAALELRKSGTPVCGAGCSTCGLETEGALDRWISAQTNPPASNSTLTLPSR
jgi:hypothetical protein